MSVYTCITCRVVFVDGETQRAHYKTDWHRYNLKRKVSDLAPVSAENFKQRVLNAQTKQVAAEKSSGMCTLCGKHFSTENQLKNHMQSKKHKDLEAKEAERERKKVERMNKKNEGNKEVVTEGHVTRSNKDVTNKAVKEGSGDAALGSGNTVSGTQGTTAPPGGVTVEDMEEGDTDSEVESVESFGDEEGLGIEECLFCSHISQSLESNVEHMTSKHSFFMPDAEFITDLEGLITYLGQKVGLGYMCLWCNEKGKVFHNTKSVQKHMLDKGHCKLLHEGNVLVEYAAYYDYRSSYPDNEGSNHGDTEDMEVDQEVDVNSLDTDGFELVLPSGATIGHRSLQKYYKQNINPRSAERTKSILPRMLAQYKALGWHGASGPVIERRVKDLGAMQRLKSRHYAQLGVKANKFQPHLRPQVLF